jgi:hypothetical protein
MTVADAPEVAPPLSARQHALRVAVLDALTDVAGGALAKARAEAGPELAEARRDGQERQRALLPDGTEVGLLSIKAGITTVSPCEDDLLAWVAERCPGELEDYVVPAAWSSADLIDLVRAAFPHLVRTRVRESARKKLLAEARANGGRVADKDTGASAVIASVVSHLPTGEFAYKPEPGAAHRIVADWVAGRLQADGVNELLALPAAGGEQQ